MVQHWFVFLLCSLSFQLGFAQDERYFRQVLSGKLPKLFEQERVDPTPELVFKGPFYHIDLNGDGIEETIQPQFKNGQNWIEIRNSSQNKLFEAKLWSMGGDGQLYKIKLVHLSSKVKTLILFLDEGSTTGKRFESTARIFLLSFENNDLSTLKLAIGPHFYHEKEAQRDQYLRRDYMVNVYDIDQDGMRDIAIQYNHIQRILRYKGEGEWHRF